MSRHCYGSARDQHGSLRLPRGQAPAGGFPVAVLIHGGSWSTRYGKIVVWQLQRDLARRGWAAWNIEYRRVGERSGGGWPQTGADVLAAIDLLAEIDAPLDPTRVAVLGHSAGGQLALFAAAERAANPGAAGAGVRLQAVVAMAAPCDLERSVREGAPTIEHFMGGHPDVVPEHYAQASPIARAPLGVPTLLVHGDADQIVSFGSSKRYADRAGALGDDATLVAIDGAGHQVHLNPRGEAWAAAVSWLERFR